MVAKKPPQELLPLFFDLYQFLIALLSYLRDVQADCSLFQTAVHIVNKLSQVRATHAALLLPIIDMLIQLYDRLSAQIEVVPCLYYHIYCKAICSLAYN